MMGNVRQEIWWSTAVTTTKETSLAVTWHLETVIKNNTQTEIQWDLIWHAIKGELG